MVFVKKIHKTGRVFNMDEFEAAAARVAPAAAAAAPVEGDGQGPTAAGIEIEEYLKSWGLSIYINKFKEHSIDLETLQILSADDIKDLVPVIGHRAKLITQIAMLKNIITDAFSHANKTMEEVEDGISMNDVYLIDGPAYTLTEQAEEQSTSAEPQREMFG